MLHINIDRRRVWISCVFQKPDFSKDPTKAPTKNKFAALNEYSEFHKILFFFNKIPKKKTSYRRR